MNIFFVALGGALGASLRWLTSCAVLQLNKHLPAQLPLFYATFLCNCLGCFIIGFASTLFLHGFSQGIPLNTNTLLNGLFSLYIKHEHFKLFLITGLLGGFTTFSTFSLESLDLLEQASLTQAGLYIAASIAVCLFACFAGKLCAQNLLS